MPRRRRRAAELAPWAAAVGVFLVTLGAQLAEHPHAPAPIPSVAPDADSRAPAPFGGVAAGQTPGGAETAAPDALAASPRATATTRPPAPAPPDPPPGGGDVVQAVIAAALAALMSLGGIAVRMSAQNARSLGGVIPAV